MSHAFRTASSAVRKDFEESFPQCRGSSQSATATCFPSPFAAVADLATFDDVDNVFVGNVLVVAFIVVVRCRSSLGPR